MEIFLFALLTLVSTFNPLPKNHIQSNGDVKQVIIKPGVVDYKVSSEWLDALKTRETKEYRDSLGQLSRPLSANESRWFELIESKAHSWNQMRDSLKVPFDNITINDTIYVLLGYRGKDDGFTYKYQTVCFDLTALYNTYGSAYDPVNDNRIDRLFAHEYTHLLSKEWVRQKNLQVNNFKDSILWECMYEGIGMYRSMSAKWFPIGGKLSETSAKTFKMLYPIFTERIITIDTMDSFSPEDKIRLNKHLSKAPMDKKWGALPVGVWLAMEAQGDDAKLQKWIDMGYEAIIPLALKYLERESKVKFEQHFSNNE